jgi:hypothetical protein
MSAARIAAILRVSTIEALPPRRQDSTKNANPVSPRREGSSKADGSPDEGSLGRPAAERLNRREDCHQEKQKQKIAFILFRGIMDDMSDIRLAGAASSPAPAPDDLDALARCAVASVVHAGASILGREPWRVARIVRGAEAMTIGEIRAHGARRRRGAPPADLNLAIALAQLSLALAAPSFEAVWMAWLSSRCEE